MHLEHTLPRLEIDHEQLKVVKCDARSMLFVHEADNLTTHVKIGTRSNVVVRQTRLEKLLQIKAVDGSENEKHLIVSSFPFDLFFVVCFSLVIISQLEKHGLVLCCSTSYARDIIVGLIQLV